MTKSLRLIKLLTRIGETVMRLTRATAMLNNYRGIYRHTSNGGSHCLVTKKNCCVKTELQKGIFSLVIFHQPIKIFLAGLPV